MNLNTDYVLIAVGVDSPSGTSYTNSSDLNGAVSQ